MAQIIKYQNICVFLVYRLMTEVQLFVANLNYRTNSEQLKAFLSAAGEVFDNLLFFIFLYFSFKKYNLVFQS